jgi:hypothetical protein
VEQLRRIIAKAQQASNLLIEQQGWKKSYTDVKEQWRQAEAEARPLMRRIWRDEYEPRVVLTLANMLNAHLQ